MLVLLDTNVWVAATRLLRAGVGPVFLHYLAVRQGKLLLPDIIRNEIYSECHREVAQASSEISTAYGKVEHLLGERDEYRLPTLAEVDQGVEKRLAQLGPMTQAVETADALLLAAAKRCLEKRRPYSPTGNDAFKDCAIWESILSMPPGTDIALVSQDYRAFSKAQKKTESAEFDPQLAEESTNAGLKISAFFDLGHLLHSWRDSGPPIDVARAKREIDAALEGTKEKLVAKWCLDDLQMSDCELESYITENPGRVFIRFEVDYYSEGCVLDEIVIRDVRVHLKGNCYLELPTYKVAPDSVQIEIEELHDATGMLKRGATVYAQAGTLFVGRRRRAYRDRQKL